MAATPTFGDWNAVSDTYGPQISQMLQNNNVPLSQVGQAISQINPNFFQGGSFPGSGFQSGGSDPGNASIPNSPYGFTQLGGNQALAQALGQSGGQQQQGPSFDPTKNPNYPTSLLGAQALQAVGLNPNRQVTTNPSPADTPSSTQFAQSGVSSVASPQTTQYAANTPMPQTQGTPSLFNPATPLAPTGGQNPLLPATQSNAAQMSQQGGGAGTPYASVPAITPPPAPTAQSGGMSGYGTGSVNHPFVASPGMGNLTPTPGMNAPSPNAGVQSKLLASIPHFQDGGTLDAGGIGLVGENGPELLIAPDTSDIQIAPISGTMPTGQSQNAQAFNQPISGYGPGYPAPQQQPAAQQPPAAPNRTVSTQTASQPMPQQQFRPQPANQVGPPTPVPNQATGVNTNQVSTTANQAANQAINSVYHQNNMQKLAQVRQMLSQVGQSGRSLAENSQGSRQPIQSAIPQPPAAPGATQLKQLAVQGNSQTPMLSPQEQQQMAALYG